jgi:hypothetical protein
MARIRTIKPEFWTDEKLSPCDPLTRLVFLGLVSLADDAGRIVDNLRYIDAQLFMNTSDTAHEPLMRLSGMGRIVRGLTASGQPVIQIVNWSRHQKIQHPNLKGSLPEIVTVQQVTAIHEPLMSDSGAIHEPLMSRSRTIPTTNDQRPTTNDLTNADGALRAPSVPERTPKRKRTPKPDAAIKWPDWPQPVRAKMHERWRSRLGDVPYPQWVAALGPVFGTPPAPWTLAQMAGAYDSWLSSVGSGGPSSPFLRRNPAACASVLSAIAAINDTMRPDDPERLDAIDRVVHGKAA